MDLLDQALDCDLAYCPLTNLMPVLRHRLHREPGRHDLVMAWVRLPELTVSRIAASNDTNPADPRTHANRRHTHSNPPDTGRPSGTTAPPSPNTNLLLARTPLTWPCRATPGQGYAQSRLCWSEGVSWGWGRPRMVSRRWGWLRMRLRVAAILV